MRIPDLSVYAGGQEKMRVQVPLLIFDEVQTGFGRTGTFWAFEDYGIYPDMLVCASSMGGGMPIGAFMASEKVMSVLMENPALGISLLSEDDPVSCAASLATLQVIREERLYASARHKGEMIRKALSGHPLVREVRAKA